MVPLRKRASAGRNKRQHNQSLEAAPESFAASSGSGSGALQLRR